MMFFDYSAYPNDMRKLVGNTHLYKKVLKELMVSLKNGELVTVQFTENDNGHVVDVQVYSMDAESAYNYMQNGGMWGYDNPMDYLVEL